MAQANSIYEVSNWAAATSYNRWDIVLNGSYYYYSAIDHTSTSSFTNDYNAGKWDGIGTAPNGSTKPKFLWNSIYNSPIIAQPKTRVLNLGDGYQQRAKEGINHNLISIDCTFDGKTLQESVALVHFLYARQGIESFLWTPPRPYGQQKLFICAEWTTTPNFYDSYQVQATLQEVVN